MKKISIIFTTISVLFGTLPGIGVLTTALMVPPQTSLSLFAATVEATGILTLLMLWTNRDWIRQATFKKINFLAIIGALTFLITLSSYLYFSYCQIVEVTGSTPIFFPFFPEGELKEGLDKYNSAYKLIQSWGKDDVYKVILSSSQISLAYTKVIFLFIYQLIFVSLTFSFGILGIKTN